jgi:hypothetical protein
MKETSYLIIGRKGIKSIRKTKPSLDWDEIACKISLDIPDELFRRPHIEAKLVVKDIPNEAYNPEIIINTKELIEQQTGAKIDFRVIHEEVKKDESYGIPEAEWR